MVSKARFRPNFESIKPENKQCLKINTAGLLASVVEGAVIKCNYSLRFVLFAYTFPLLCVHIFPLVSHCTMPFGCQIDWGKRVLLSETSVAHENKHSTTWNVIALATSCRVNDWYVSYVCVPSWEVGGLRAFPFRSLKWDHWSHDLTKSAIIHAKLSQSIFIAVAIITVLNVFYYR